MAVVQKSDRQCGDARWANPALWFARWKRADPFGDRIVDARTVCVR